MANPRKFSEKIALHTHRQAEETAAFEKIMKEVYDVKVAPQSSSSSSSTKNSLRIVGAPLGHTFRGGGSLPDVTARPPPPPKTPSVEPHTQPNEEPPTTSTQRMQTTQPNNSRQSRTRSPGGPIRPGRERKPSPYSGPYLSPPSDTQWRRTHSDSALHHSTMLEMVPDGAQRWPMTLNGPERVSDGRPRSSCDVPRVPGIHIYPSAHDPGMVQIPIGNNTGSLPDLTNMDFTSPIHVPLDQDQDQGSPYSSSPNNTSPSTLSPSSMIGGGGGVRQPSQHNQFNFNPPISQHNPQSNHLSVPGNCRYPRFQQRSLSQSDKSIGMVDNGDFSQIGAIYQQSGSPTSPVQLPQMDGYRNNSSRPSPQPSPTMGGRHSAPCSPGEPSPLQNDYHLHNQTMQFQQHFEQLTVDWAQLVASLVESGCTWTAQLESDPPIGQINYGTDQSAQSHSEVSADGGYYSTSPSGQQLVYPSTSPGLHTTSPNTPTSLPEIILTDFSASQELTRQFESDLLDEQLKEGLGAIDFAELQILNNISGMSEIVEDFRS